MTARERKTHERKARGANHYRMVLAAGLATTALAVGLMYLVTSPTSLFLGSYELDIIPGGAMIIGFLSSIGYALGSRRTGVRMSHVMIGVVGALLVGSYFVALRVESLAIGVVHEKNPPIGVVEDDADSYGVETDETALDEPPGAYTRPRYKLLECIGFVLSGLIVPLTLLRVPYCKKCKMYLKRRKLGTFPAGNLARAGRTRKKEPEPPKDPDAPRTGLDLVHHLVDLAKQGDTAAFGSTLAAHGTSARKARKQKRWVVLILYRCPRCNVGFLRAAGHAKSSKEKSGKVIGQWRIEPEVVEALSKKA